MLINNHARFSPHARLLVAVAIASLTAGVLPKLHLAARSLCAWDAGMICFLGFTWWGMMRATPASMQKTAQREDEGRLIISIVVTISACVSLLAIGFVLEGKQNNPVPLIVLHIVLAAVTIVGSWLLVHTIFALHYAHAYYRPSSHPVLDFPGKNKPDYWDFMYFSLVIGMTSQVSDVTIQTSALRRLTLAHSVLAFFFNATIIAMSVNIIAGLVQ